MSIIIEGLSPAISIEQKSISKNPRSTVGTVTEIYDYLRLLFARLGRVYCYGCGKEIKSQHAPQIVDAIRALGAGTQLTVLAPIVRGRKGEYRKEIDDLRRQGFTRIKLNGKMVDLAEPIVLDKKKKHQIDVVIDRLTIREGIERRLFEAVELALNKAGGIVKVETGGETLVFSEKFACPDCGISYPEITPAMFSFNNPYGACPTCLGLGVKEYFDPDLIVPNKDLSLREGAIMAWGERNPLVFMPFLESLVNHYGIDIRAPFKDLPQEVQDVLFYGSKGEQIEFLVEHGHRRQPVKKPFEGVIKELEREWQGAGPWEKERFERYINLIPCPACKGARLKKEMLWVRFGDLSISQVTEMTIAEGYRFFKDIHLAEKEREIARPILKEITARLKFLIDVGLDYISLERPSATLSSGESQRIRLATQIGSGLTGVLYVLDEPSIGLHQRDNERLLATLEQPAGPRQHGHRGGARLRHDPPRRSRDRPGARRRRERGVPCLWRDPRGVEG